MNIAGKHLINFTLGTPKHLHDKLFNEYNFCYGFSKFAAYFINKHGEISICSPVIPHKFQSSLPSIDALRYHFKANNTVNDDTEEEQTGFDEDNQLFDLWLNQTWNVSVINENTSRNILNESILNQSCLPTIGQQTAYASYNAKSQFIDNENNQEIYRGIYKLNILQTNKKKNNDTCTKIIMLDLDSFFFNDQLKQINKKIIDENEEYDFDDIAPTNILPIFIRIWSDHSIDIVCCKNAIHPSWNIYDKNNSKILSSFDAIVICKNYLDFNDKDNQFFMIQKCVQNLDELIFGHNFEGLYRLKMNWLNKIPFELNQGLLKYFQFLQNCDTNIEQIPLYKFYMNSQQRAYNAILSDLCISKYNNNYNQNNDQLIILDENLKKIHVFPLFNIDVNKMNESVLLDQNDDDNKYENDDWSSTQKKEKKYELDTKFDMNIMKPFDISNIEEIKENLKNIKFNFNQFPQDFSLSDPKSLKWFVENIKIKIEREIFDKMELGQVMMSERKAFIENDLYEYIIPQVTLIQDKTRQISKNNENLKNKLSEIMDNQKDLENKICSMQIKINELNDNFCNNNNLELNRYKHILKDYKKEYDALIYSFNQLNQYKIPNRNLHENINIGNQEIKHLQAKIKKSLIHSHKKIQQMKNDKIGLEALEKRIV